LFPPFVSTQELVLEDSLGGKVAKTLLYKLSESGTLEHFRKVVLLSSPKDQYVPAYSARIQVSRLALHWGYLITNPSSCLLRGHMDSLCDLYGCYYISYYTLATM
jgi:hypothetical protein